ncbi:hypothetical protein H696_00658 [Fonticula alba]|uniref:SEC7 domain-containing protein n=1 Tax=Fonticula alba TaxID=691883 RepID=A0A058ZFI4_FONAL|nr:hypothetical protein H696_00658 [Fonticula alba]KCV73114.1 hypothetical protein H696_00658 [Fonticula alba]|eukprot:XP_009492815.1 hypothetical protein H696_00658 [Fonticula alba]
MASSDLPSPVNATPVSEGSPFRATGTASNPLTWQKSVAVLQTALQQLTAGVGPIANFVGNSPLLGEVQSALSSAQARFEEVARAVPPSSNDATPNGDLFWPPFRAALRLASPDPADTREVHPQLSVLADIALDQIEKLLLFGLLRGQQRDPVTGLRMMDEVVSVVCGLAHGGRGSEQVHIQLLRLLLTMTTMTQSPHSAASAGAGSSAPASGMATPVGDGGEPLHTGLPLMSGTSLVRALHTVATISTLRSKSTIIQTTGRANLMRITHAAVSRAVNVEAAEVDTPYAETLRADVYGILRHLSLLSLPRAEATTLLAAADEAAASRSTAATPSKEAASPAVASFRAIDLGPSGLTVPWSADSHELYCRPLALEMIRSVLISASPGAAAMSVAMLSQMSPPDLSSTSIPVPSSQTFSTKAAEFLWLSEACVGLMRRDVCTAISYATQGSITIYKHALMIFVRVLAMYQAPLKPEIRRLFRDLFFRVLEVVPTGSTSMSAHANQLPAHHLRAAQAIANGLPLASTSPEAVLLMQRSLALQSLNLILGDAQTLVDLYLNYDCDTAGEDVLEPLLSAVARVAIYWRHGGSSLAVAGPSAPAAGNATATAAVGPVGAAGGATGVGAPLEEVRRHPDHILPPALPPATQHPDRDVNLNMAIRLRSRALHCLASVVKAMVAWTSSASHAGGPADQSSSAAGGTSPVDDATNGAGVDLMSTADSGTSSASSVIGTPDPAMSSPLLAPLSSSHSLSGPGVRVGDDNPDQFVEQKSRKLLLRQGLDLFNQKPSRGIKHLIGHQFISPSPDVVARFLLQHCQSLDKAQLGDFLSGPESFNNKVMHAFVDLLDFKGMSFVEALRLFLQTFRLPGEAQKIDRLMEKFADRYCESNQQPAAPGSSLISSASWAAVSPMATSPDRRAGEEGATPPIGSAGALSLLSNADTAYTLAFSTIMLNTDLHSDQIKRKMSKESFIKNNRGINKGFDLPSSLLESIYDEILHNEIVLEEERGDRGGHSTLSAQLWRMLHHATSGGDNGADGDGFESHDGIYHRATHREHILPMFKAFWRSNFLLPFGQAVAECDPNDVNTAELCMVGYESAVRIACSFGLVEARDSLLRSLALHIRSLSATNLINSLGVSGGVLASPAAALPANPASGTALGGGSSGRDSRSSFGSGSMLLPTSDLVVVQCLLERIAPQNSQSLGNSWKFILEAVSRLEYLGLFGTDSRTSAGRVPVQQNPSAGIEAGAEASGAGGHPSFDAAQSLTVLVDRLFERSGLLPGKAIVDFFRGLCAVSIAEVNGGCFDLSQTLPDYSQLFAESKAESPTHQHTTAPDSSAVEGLPGRSPRLFSLQKVVELAHYNLNRIRLEWTPILQQVLQPYFNHVGCHRNPVVASFAIDSLRQLAMKFLERQEMGQFHTQSEFLRPFEYIVIHAPLRPLLSNGSRRGSASGGSATPGAGAGAGAGANLRPAGGDLPLAQDLVLRALNHMVEARAGRIMSGWKSIFVVLMRVVEAARRPELGIGASNADDSGHAEVQLELTTRTRRELVAAGFQLAQTIFHALASERSLFGGSGPAPAPMAGGPPSTDNGDSSVSGVDSPSQGSLHGRPTSANHFADFIDCLAEFAFLSGVFGGDLPPAVASAPDQPGGATSGPIGITPDPFEAVAQGAVQLIQNCGNMQITAHLDWLSATAAATAAAAGVTPTAVGGAHSPAASSTGSSGSLLLVNAPPGPGSSGGPEDCEDFFVRWFAVVRCLSRVANDCGSMTIRQKAIESLFNLLHGAAGTGVLESAAYARTVFRSAIQPLFDDLCEQSALAPGGGVDPLAPGGVAGPDSDSAIGAWHARHQDKCRMLWVFALQHLVDLVPVYYGSFAHEPFPTIPLSRPTYHSDGEEDDDEEQEELSATEVPPLPAALLPSEHPHMLVDESSGIPLVAKLPSNSILGAVLELILQFIAHRSTSVAKAGGVTGLFSLMSLCHDQFDARAWRLVTLTLARAFAATSTERELSRAPTVRSNAPGALDILYCFVKATVQLYLARSLLDISNPSSALSAVTCTAPRADFFGWLQLLRSSHENARAFNVDSPRRLAFVQAGYMAKTPSLSQQESVALEAYVQLYFRWLQLRGTGIDGDQGAGAVHAAPGGEAILSPTLGANPVDLVPPLMDLCISQLQYFSAILQLPSGAPSGAPGATTGGPTVASPRDVEILQRAPLVAAIIQELIQLHWGQIPLRSGATPMSATLTTPIEPGSIAVYIPRLARLLTILQGCDVLAVRRAVQNFFRALCDALFGLGVGDMGSLDDESPVLGPAPAATGGLYHPHGGHGGGHHPPAAEHHLHHPGPSGSLTIVRPSIPSSVSPPVAGGSRTG